MGAGKGIRTEICLLLHHTKNFLISLMYFFAVQLDLELSKTLNKELRPARKIVNINTKFITKEKEREIELESNNLTNKQPKYILKEKTSIPFMTSAI